MKKRLVLLLAVVIGMFAIGCGQPTKTLHCDHCGKALEVSADSNMEEDWIIYCGECQVELGLDNLIE